jgi:hypothetical protein
MEDFLRSKLWWSKRALTSTGNKRLGFLRLMIVSMSTKGARVKFGYPSMSMGRKRGPTTMLKPLSSGLPSIRKKKAQETAQALRQGKLNGEVQWLRLVPLSLSTLQEVRVEAFARREALHSTVPKTRQEWLLPET